jgi:hypothetical protein
MVLSSEAAKIILARSSRRHPAALRFERENLFPRLEYNEGVAVLEPEIGRRIRDHLFRALHGHHPESPPLAEVDLT